ncbi:MAG: hypothetical protein WBC74_00950 [Candidatus Omnitrophota bacterium]
MNKKGIIFIAVMIISMLMVFIAVAASNMILQDVHIVRHLKYSIQAQYLAEAGVSDALARLVTLSAISFSENLAGGTYDVTVSEAGGRYLIASVGTFQNIPRTVALEVKGSYPDWTSQALATAGDITIKAVQGSVTIKGDMHANGNMELVEQGPSTALSVEAYGGFAGDATCSGIFTPLSGTVSIAGTYGGGEDMLEMPSFNFTYFKTVAQQEGVYYSSCPPGGFNNVTFTGGTAGITYVDDNVQFKGTCTITGGFVAAGDIDLKKNNSIVQQHDTNNRFPIFMSGGGCVLYGLFDTQEGNIVYATNSMKIRTPGGQSLVMGTVLSGGWLDVVANNAITLTYGMVDADEVVPLDIEVVSWNK